MNRELRKLFELNNRVVVPPLLPKKSLNYLCIPIIKTNDRYAFNNISRYMFKNRKCNPIIRTASGGISKKTSLPCCDVRAFNSFIEMTIVQRIDEGGMIRIHYSDASTHGNKTIKPVGAWKALEQFEKDCKMLKIDNPLKKYAIHTSEELMEYRKNIDKPIIKLESQHFKDYIFYDNIHHLDLNFSYPACLAETHPEFKPVIELWAKRKKDDITFKGYGESLIGGFQHTFQDYKGKHPEIITKGNKYIKLAQDALHANTIKIKSMSKWLKETGRTVIAYNTDGIWFQGKKTNLKETRLGGWKEDYQDCKQIRFKSAGVYEFIDKDNNYHVRMRGRTNYDKINCRDNWQWGDIYRTDASPIILKVIDNQIIEINKEIDKDEKTNI